MTQPTRQDGLDAPSRGPSPDGVSRSSTGTALLSVADLSIRFGGIVALDSVSFQVEAGKICGLIGPNGAGKTTLFNCLSRLYNPQRGEIHFDGRSLSSVLKHQIAALGIGRTFQNLALFGTMTVLENVMIGTHAIARGGFIVNGLNLPRRKFKSVLS